MKNPAETAVQQAVRLYSRHEHLADAVVHVLGILFAINASLWLLFHVTGLSVVASVTIYCLGLLAMIAPQVMSSGHGALRFSGVFQLSLATVALLFVLKIVASVISLGSGFRGGLFFSSLLIGALGGNLLAVALTMIWPGVDFDSNAYAVIGMSGLSAAVITFLRISR